ncbi:MAG: DUF447 domain-containing protein [Isosphaeraceae bacterium]
MILEGIVTSLSAENVLNIAPMGPEVDAGMNMERFVLRPYQTSTTYANLRARGEGVLHVTDDVLLLAQTAIGAAVEPPPPTRPADVVDGVILLDSCRFYEFRVVDLDDRQDRTRIVVETVAHGRHRDFFGFNRAKHAVVEAAVLATRTAWLPLKELLLEFRKLEVLVQKTGGPSEQAAFRLLDEFLRETAVRRGIDPDVRPSPP